MAVFSRLLLISIIHKPVKYAANNTKLDDNMTRTTRGTGLGLYIVKGLANAMEINLKLDIDDYFTMTLEFSDYVK